MNVREVHLRYTPSDVVFDDDKLTKSVEVYRAFKEFTLEPVEQFICLYLDSKNRISCFEVISRGTLNRSLVHPREIFCGAVHVRAAAVICIHNHPSGDPEPSPEDIAMTNRIVQSGKLIGIPVLDHLIITEFGYFSFADEGML